MTERLEELRAIFGSFARDDDRRRRRRRGAHRLLAVPHRMPFEASPGAVYGSPRDCSRSAWS